MRFEQIKDVVDHAKQFHHMIANYYRKLRKKTDQTRFKLLLEYLEHHERAIAKALKGYEVEGSEKILRVWLPYSTFDEKLEELKTLLAQPSAAIEDVVRLVIEADDALIDLYRGMAARVTSPDVKRVFEDLILLEDNEKRIVARDCLELYDF